MSFDNIFDKNKDKDPHAAIHHPGDIHISSRVPYGILTGLPMLDRGIGKPGYPAGRVVELFGFEKSGKTTAAYHALANAQRVGGGGLFIDTEYSWDEERATDIGIDVEANLRIGEAETIEAIFRQIDDTLKGIIESRYEATFVIVVDSITAVQTEVNKQATFGAEPRIGQDARVIRHGMRKIVSDVAKSNVCLIFINHAISTIPKFQFAKQSTSAGGHAIKLFSAIRCQFGAGSDIKDPKDKDRILGQEVFLKLEKVKGSRLEYPKFKINLYNEGGFDTQGNLLDAAISTGFVTHTKSSKTYALVHPEVVEFPKADWPGIVESMGGIDNAYIRWVNWCVENDVLKRWGG